jgi:hypothetical protein
LENGHSPANIRHRETALRILPDCFGYAVRLTDERLEHILQHPEMVGFEEAIADALAVPEEIRLSRSDAEARLFYRHYDQTPVGAKWLCVVVKYHGNDPFIVTAYLTDKPKSGELIWPIP